MAQTFSYHGVIKKYIHYFASLFNELTIRQPNPENASGFQQVHVPISYSGKQRYIERLQKDPLLNQKHAIRLPRIGFNMSSMTYDPTRQLHRLNDIRVSSGPGSVNRVFTPVPYNFDFDLSIFVKSAEDGAQLVEQIIPIFRPDYTRTLRLVPQIPSMVLDIPVILNSITSEEVFENDSISRSAIIWNLSFTLRGYIIPQLRTGDKIILSTEVTFFDDLDPNRNRVLVLTSKDGEPDFVLDTSQELSEEDFQSEVLAFARDINNAVDLSEQTFIEINRYGFLFQQVSQDAGWFHYLDSINSIAQELSTQNSNTFFESSLFPAYDRLLAEEYITPEEINLIGSLLTNSTSYIDRLQAIADFSPYHVEFTQNLDIVSAQSGSLILTDIANSILLDSSANLINSFSLYSDDPSAPNKELVVNAFFFDRTTTGNTTPSGLPFTHEVTKFSSDPADLFTFQPGDEICFAEDLLRGTQYNAFLNVVEVTEYTLYLSNANSTIDTGTYRLRLESFLPPSGYVFYTGNTDEFTTYVGSGEGNVQSSVGVLEYRLRDDGFVLGIEGQNGNLYSTLTTGSVVGADPFGGGIAISSGSSGVPTAPAGTLATIVFNSLRQGVIQQYPNRSTQTLTFESSRASFTAEGVVDHDGPSEAYFFVTNFLSGNPRLPIGFGGQSVVVTSPPPPLEIYTNPDRFVWPEIVSSFRIGNDFIASDNANTIEGRVESILSSGNVHTIEFSTFGEPNTNSFSFDGVVNISIGNTSLGYLIESNSL